MSTLTLPASTQAVIFDCDGVLVDSWNAGKFFFNSMRQAVGLGPLSPEEEAACFVRTIPESLDMIIPPDRREQADQAWKSFDLNEILDLIRPHEGVADLLERLRNAGKGLAVCTNGGAEQHTILERHGLLGFFDLLITTEDVARGKPWPDGVETILRHFRIRPEQAVYIGDSAVDQRTARNANVPFWAYADPTLEAGAHIRHFADVRLP